MQSTSSHRLHELDWLRVLAILGVFFHHGCQPFNGDGWHIMNKETSQVLDDIMVFFEQVRLPILFLVSGAGSVILLSKRPVGVYVSERLQRLLVPLAVGVLLIIPPQTYIEFIDRYGPYWEAYPAVVSEFKLNHLWFIEYLVVFAMLAVPLFRLIRSDRGQRWLNILGRIAAHPAGWFLPAFLIAVLRIGLKKLYPGYELGIANLSSSLFYFVFFVFGMVIVSRETLWHSIRRYRRANLYFFLACTTLFYAYHLPDFSAYASYETRWTLWWAPASMLSWSATLTALGYAQEYLRTAPAWLVRANELIFPFYILHQTVIIVFGYFVIQWHWSIAMKIMLIMAVSFPVTALLCLFVVAPFNWIRILFGLKRTTATPATTLKAENSARSFVIE